jgi:Zn finger protein HypA/HybF involved in hydrogenase expression
MVGLRDAAAFQGKLIEFQSKIIDANNAAFAAQDERAALLERIRELEKQVADFKAWETEKQRYELTALSHGAFAYALKKEAARGEPPHWICAACYSKGEKTILQCASNPNLVQVRYKCPRCHSEILVHT